VKGSEKEDKRELKKKKEVSSSDLSSSHRDDLLWIGFYSQASRLYCLYSLFSADFFSREFSPGYKRSWVELKQLMLKVFTHSFITIYHRSIFLSFTDQR